jgi:hypothetical protein
MRYALAPRWVWLACEPVQWMHPSRLAACLGSACAGWVPQLGSSGLRAMNRRLLCLHPLAALEPQDAHDPASRWLLLDRPGLQSVVDAVQESFLAACVRRTIRRSDLLALKAELGAERFDALLHRGADPCPAPSGAPTNAVHTEGWAAAAAWVALLALFEPSSSALAGRFRLRSPSSLLPVQPPYSGAEQAVFADHLRSELVPRHLQDWQWMF